MSNKQYEIEFLTNEEVINAYYEIIKLYPYTPSLSMWRAWEYAAYKKEKLISPILDVGCGDGRYFEFVWGDKHIVTGIDLEENVCQLAKISGAYKEVECVNAAEITYSKKFKSVFANCSLEHMENIETIIKNIYNSLKDEGIFISSIVTDKFLKQGIYNEVLGLYLDNKKMQTFNQKYINYHHVVNDLTIQQWAELYEKCKFNIIKIVPIIPKKYGDLFLAIDKLWHTECNGNQEYGTRMQKAFQKTNKFPLGFGKILEGILDMEEERCTEDFLSAVFVCKKEIDQ